MNDLDVLLDNYESEWKKEFSPNLEQFLLQNHVADTTFVWELVKIDMDYRIRRFHPSASLPTSLPFQFESYQRALVRRTLIPKEDKSTPRATYISVMATELKARLAICEQVNISEYKRRFPRLSLRDLQTLRDSYREVLLNKWHSSRKTPISMSFLEDLQIDLDQFVMALVKRQLLTIEETDNDLATLHSPESAKALADLLLERNRLNPFQAFVVLFAPDEPVRIEKFAIEQYLNEGGMGVIYLALDEYLRRKVVIKLLRHDSISSTSAKRFQLEIEVLARLQHSNIVAAYAGGSVENKPYLVMEYIQGQDLSSYVRKHGPYPPLEAVSLMRDAAKALQYAHERGIIHRDIKPSNLIRCEEQGRLRVLDLGIAKLVDDTSETLTAAGAPIGTPIYMAPEQAMGDKADERSDIYSLGSTLYFLVTGRELFSGSSQVVILSAVASGVSDRHFKNLPQDLDQLVPLLRSLLSHDPENRPQTMSEVIDWCDRLLSRTTGISDTTMSPSTSIAGRYNWPAIWFSALTGAVAAFALLYFLR